MRKLSDILGVAFESPEVLEAARAQAIMRDWESVVGPLLAEKTVPDRFERGVIWVTVSGSAWAQEVRLNQEEIVRRLNEKAGERDLFKSLRVGLRRR